MSAALGNGTGGLVPASATELPPTRAYEDSSDPEAAPERESANYAGPVPKDQARHSSDSKEYGGITFDLRPWTDHASEDGETVEYLVSDLLPEGGMSILGAPPKCGKSTTVRCLAATVAGARDEWMGRSVKHGPVLYFSMEGPPSIAFEHFSKIDPHGSVVCTMQTKDTPPPEARFAAMEHAIRKHRPRLVIVDTLVKFLTDLDEINDYGQVCKALSVYEAMLPKYGAHLMWIHHVGKDSPGVSRRHGAELLGSTGLQGSVDTILILKWVDGDQRQIYSTNRAGVDMPQTVVREDKPSGWVYAVGERAALDRASLQDRVLQYLGDQDGWVPLSTCKREIEGRDSEITAALRKLTELGLIQFRKDGRAMNYAHAEALGTGTAQLGQPILFGGQT